MKARIKAGDEIVVIAGNSRGERGKILQVNPKAERVLVEGVNKRKFHEKRGRRGQDDEGGIREREAPIHISNVMLAERWDARKGKQA